MSRGAVVRDPGRTAEGLFSQWRNLVKKLEELQRSLPAPISSEGVSDEKTLELIEAYNKTRSALVGITSYTAPRR